MKLADEIIDMLSSQGGSLNDALFKTKVLLHRMGEKDLVDWVNLELQGYTGREDVPEYRIIDMSIRGDVSNLAYRYNDHPLPTGHLDEPLRRDLRKTALRQSVAVLEGFAKDDKDLSINVAPELYNKLSKGLGNGYNVERAWGKPSLGCMVQVVTEIKSRLLDFLLELSERMPDGLDREEMKEESKRQNISNLFNHTVIGDNATFVIGDGNVQNVENNVKINDFESLAAELKRINVVDDDIDELRQALLADEGAQELSEGKIGPGVSGWIGKMVGKASSSTWAVGVGAAGGLLAAAIKAYYGF